MRLKPGTVAKARSLDPLLALLLPTVREIGVAQQELKWLRQEIKDPIKLRQACIRRGHLNVPLQYILGTQPFGNLDIQCRPGVLIPRWETEEWCLNLCRLLRAHNKQSGLDIVDLCTGTGCIPLTIAKECGVHANKISGVDISPQAISLFRLNVRTHFPAADTSIHPILGDVFQPLEMFQSQTGIRSADLVTANPPYIDPAQLVDPLHTERSVRRHEPRLALVGGVDIYRAIFNLSQGLKAKAIVLEVGSLSQIDFLKSIAPPNWQSVPIKDSADNYRAIALWNHPHFAFLKKMA
jgi:HemK-like putative methylase